MSNSSVSRIRTALASKRWTILLPAGMLALTAELVHLDGLWMRGAGYWDDLPVTTAVGLVALLNGPGYFVFNAFRNIFGTFGDSAPYLGCIAYWGWIGYVLDRRQVGNLRPVLTSQRLRLAAYCIGVAVASAFLFAEVAQPVSPFDPRYFRVVWNVAISGSHKCLLLGRQVASIAGAIWAVSYVVYFLVKLWRLALTWNRQTDTGFRA